MFFHHENIVFIPSFLNTDSDSMYKLNQYFSTQKQNKHLYL